jgi:hypothetical protein
MELTFKYRTNRWNGPTTLRLTHNADGWHLGANAYTGQVTPNGAPLLFGNFDQDGVSYPRGIDLQLEYAWDQIAAGVWDEQDAQERIQELADWVTACEEAEPRWAGWN